MDSNNRFFFSSFMSIKFFSEGFECFDIFRVFSMLVKKVKISEVEKQAKLPSGLFNIDGSGLTTSTPVRSDRRHPAGTYDPAGVRYVCTGETCYLPNVC